VHGYAKSNIVHVHRGSLRRIRVHLQSLKKGWDQWLLNGFAEAYLNSGCYVLVALFPDPYQFQFH